MTPEQWADTVSADVWDRFNKGEAPAEAGEMKRRYAEVIHKAVAEERQRVILSLEEYGRTDMTLSRLGEMLNQSPPVLRVLIRRAADRFSDER